MSSKKLTRQLVSLGAILLASVLAVSYFRSDRQLRDIMRVIAKIDTDIRRCGLADTQRHAQVDETIAFQLEKIQGPETLKAVFYACERTSRRYLYLQTQAQVLFRLADMHDDASAKILVGMLSDNNVSWDGESALNIREALIRCGSPCVPYLLRFEGQNACLALEALASIQAPDDRAQD